MGIVSPAGACTGITPQKQRDGAIVAHAPSNGRKSVMNSMYVVHPRNQELQSLPHGDGRDHVQEQARVRGSGGRTEGIHGGRNQRERSFRRTLLLSRLWQIPALRRFPERQVPGRLPGGIYVLAECGTLDEVKRGTGESPRHPYRPPFVHRALAVHRALGQTNGGIGNRERADTLR